MMVKQHITRSASLFFVLALLLMSFALSSALAQQPKHGGILRIAVENDMTRQMDARYLPPGPLYPVSRQIYEFLLAYGAKGEEEIIPGLAESWKTLDPLTYLFYLRKGVKFHNGREMTAEDLKANMDWMLKTPEGWMPVRRRGLLVGVIDKVEAVDRFTLRIKLKFPFAPLAAGIIAVNQGTAPPEEVKKWGKDFTLHPSGTGPFKFVELVPSDRVVLERFEGYWGKRPYLDKVIFRTIPDEQSRIIALQAGELDVAQVRLTGQPVVRKDPNLKMLMRLGALGGIGVWFNMRNWPMSSLKFRRAVAMAAQWDKFPVVTYSGVVVRTPLERSWMGDPKAKELLPSYDPEGARRLLKEVEAEAGKPIPTLTFLTPGLYHMAQIGELAKSTLKLVGLSLRVEPREPPFPAIQALRWDMLLVSVGGAGGDPHFLFTGFALGGLGDMPDGKNVAGYANPRVEELLKRGQVTEDRAKRKEIYQELERIILADLPSFYLYTAAITWAQNKKVQDLGVMGGDWAGIFLATPWNNTWLER